MEKLDFRGKNMGKIIYIDEKKEHIVSEVICINCKQRFLDVRLKETKLKDLECPKCKQKGYIIETGQYI